ncbi:MAG: hypothetical protein NTZ90_02685 [Proteobacteria bacterium]|nr:hypothetical protein [Pseudomonadota bacterium]
MIKPGPISACLPMACILVLAACGSHSPARMPWQKKSSSAKADVGASSQAQTTSGDAKAFDCATEKTPSEFVTTLTQDLFRRGPTSDELKRTSDPGYSPESLVDWAFTQPDYDTGIAFFVSNLLRLEQNLAVDPASRDTADAALLADLKQEPVLLVQRNRNKSWPALFTTQDFYCSARTAPLYSFPVDPNISGFVGCKMPAERGGILSLVSVLRAFPSAYYTTNNNRHRVALALYLGQGLQLAAKTDGPVGDGRPAPLASCVPEIDTRVAKGGAIFGTAAVPKIGPVCASCHTPYLAPLEPAYLRFGMKGELLQLADVDKFPNAMIQGVDRNTLRDIMQYGNKSCWSPEGQAQPAQEYTGLPGLGRLIGGSDKLANALAVQIQQNLVNKAPDSATSDAIMASYSANGESLQAALRGFFLSAPYQCAHKNGG